MERVSRVAALEHGEEGTGAVPTPIGGLRFIAAKAERFLGPLQNVKEDFYMREEHV